MSDVVYTAHAHTVGGRGGTAKTDDGKLDVKLAYPPALGGDGNGTNPEQLFAAGYGACFTGRRCPDQPWHAMRVLRDERGQAVTNRFFDHRGVAIADVDCRSSPCWR